MGCVIIDTEKRADSSMAQASAVGSCQVVPLLVLLSLITLMAPSAWTAELVDTIDRVRPGIVGVGTYLGTASPSVRLRGTGFVVAGGRYAITNAHVLPEVSQLKRGEQLAVFVGTGKAAQKRVAARIGVDTEHDVALLKFKGPPVRSLQLDSKHRVREGEYYAFTGFPIGMVLGLHPVTHTGIVSAVTPVVIPQLNARLLSSKVIRRLQDPYLVYQLDATAYPGNSGSPLYSQASGAVVGVINKVLIKETKETVIQRPSGITYAIPIKYAEALLKKHGLLPKR